MLIDAVLVDGQPQRTGRPQLMHPMAQLGLYLFYIGSTIRIKHLCFWLSLVVHKLMRCPLARIDFPDVEKMKNFAHLINQHEPEEDDVIGFMDGVALATECSSEPVEQNAIYNGYHSDTMVIKIFAYGTDGKVFLCAINFPGIWHEKLITTNVLPYILSNIGLAVLKCVSMEAFLEVVTQH